MSVMLFIALLMSSFLHASTKQIVLGTFSKSSDAENALREFQGDEVYEKMELLAKEHSFKVHVVSSQGESLLVIEPVESPVTYIEIMKILKQKSEREESQSADVSSEPVLETFKSDENQSSRLDFKEGVIAEVVPDFMQQVNKPFLAPEPAEILQEFKNRGFKWNYTPASSQDIETLSKRAEVAQAEEALEEEAAQNTQTEKLTDTQNTADTQEKPPKKYQLSEAELRAKVKAIRSEVQESNLTREEKEQALKALTANGFFSVFQVVGYYWLVLLALAVMVALYYFSEFKLILDEK